MANLLTNTLSDSGVAETGLGQGSPRPEVVVARDGASDAPDMPAGDQRFERALANVVSNFAQSPETLDLQFEPALCEFVGALDIERSTVYLAGVGEVYSWAKPGVSRITEIESREFPYTWATIKEKGAFFYYSPDELPLEAASERDYYVNRGPASLLVLPLIAAGNVFGGIAFETITFNRNWPPELVNRLKLVAELFASGLVITQAKEELAAQLRFERCISNISAALVSLSAERVDKRIMEALPELAEVLSLDRIAFLERSPVEDHFMRSHAWARGNVEPLPWQFVREYSDYVRERLLRGQTVSYSSLSEMPSETGLLRNFLEKYGVQSFLAIPLSVGGQVVAAMTAGSVGPRPWNALLVRRLTLLGETIASALVRRRQDSIVAEHQHRLRLAMQASKAHGWDWNIETGLSLWFGDSLSIFGIPPEAHTGGLEEFFRQVHPEDRDHLRQSLELAIHERVPYREEFRVIRTDGQVRWLSDRGEVLYGPDGTATRMVGISIDITDRKETELSRIAAETRYGQLLETVDAIVWRADPASSRYSFVSRQAEHILGYPIERWSQESDFWLNHLHADDRDWVMKACQEDIPKRKSHVLEYRMIASDGRVIWFHDKTKFVTDERKPVELIGIMVDITALKEAEERLRMLGGRLIEAQELERSRIARELHDDINQRLALIAIDLERFGKQGFRTERQIRAYSRGLWTKTSEVTSQISRLCGQLHSSKLEHLGLVPAVRDLCAGVVERHSLKVDFVAKSLPRNLPEDLALCIFRICQESLANVVKHSRCSRVKVRLGVKAGSLELSVIDDGMGFDSTGAVGKGLGLVSMQERVSLLAGRLTIASAAGAGTAVLARVPLPADQPTQSKCTGAAL